MAKQISQRAKEIVEKNFDVFVQGDLKQQVEAYREKKRQDALAKNPYYSSPTSSISDELVKKIVRQQLEEFLASNKYIFNKPVQFLPGRNLQFGRTLGTKIGTGTDQLLAFYGGTPVDRPASVSDPSDSAGLYDQSNAQTVVTAVKAIIARLEELNLIAPN